VRGIFWIFIVLLLCSFVSANTIRITEVMADPIFGDSYNEWVEIYNYGNESVDVNGWILGDKVENDTLIGNFAHGDGSTIIPAKSYALITDKGTAAYYNYNITKNLVKLFVDDEAICGNGLANNENLYLYNNTYFVDGFSYSATTLGDSWSLVNGSWIEQAPTPGLSNDGTYEVSYFNNCDWKVEILLDNYVFEKGTDVNWTVKVSKNYGNKAEVTVEGYVKDLSSDWKMDYHPWTNEEITSYRNQKYSPNLWEGSPYEIFYDITELGCDDTNPWNNFDRKFIIVLPGEVSSNYSAIRINELFPNPEGNDDASMPNGEWVELYNPSGTDLDLEGVGLKDDYGQDLDIFISDSNTLDGTIIPSGGFLVVYMNGRNGFLNNNDLEKISLIDEEYLIDRVSYSGSEEDLSWSLNDDIWVLTEPTPDEKNEEEYEAYNETISGGVSSTEQVIEVKTTLNTPKSESNLKDSITGNVIFEDKGEVQKRSALYFFCALMILILVYYIYGKQ